MAIIQSIFVAISILLIFFLVFPTIMITLSLFVSDKFKTKTNKSYDYGCIITAYRNADIAKGLIQSLIDQKHDNLHIYLVADNCDITGWDLEHPKLTVFNPQPALNLKAKSIIHAMDNYVRKHDFTVIFDADNLAHPDFLQVINRYANAGHTAIQGQRTAKNLDSTYACLDSLGEFYKNYIERYVPPKLGSSAVISGSGMAVETELYRAYLDGPDIQAGKELWKKMLQEDKILQNDLLRKNEQIVFAWDAITYDEKVTDGDGIETQRSRWLYSYFQNMPNSLGILRRAITGFSWNQLYFGLVTISPPLFILLFFAGIALVAGLFIAPMWSLYLGIALSIFALTILWTLYLSKVPKQVWKAVLSAPLFVFRQVLALLKMRNPNKNFKHTEHKVNVSIDDILKK